MPDVQERNRRSAGLTWEALCRDPSLQDLPYKIETNERGQIVMSPTFQSHGAYQADISGRLREHGGRVVSECAIRTSGGTKVADVGWYTVGRWDKVKEAFDSPIAPQICVEVVSPTNTAEELSEKVQLYFDAGAEEVWLCEEEGDMQFFTPEGQQSTSVRMPAFPAKIEI